jgi:hypothetical protein
LLESCSSRCAYPLPLVCLIALPSFSISERLWFFWENRIGELSRCGYSVHIGLFESFVHIFLNNFILSSHLTKIDCYLFRYDAIGQHVVPVPYGWGKVI